MRTSPSSLIPVPYLVNVRSICRVEATGEGAARYDVFDGPADMIAVPKQNALLSLTPVTTAVNKTTPIMSHTTIAPASRLTSFGGYLEKSARPSLALRDGGDLTVACPKFALG